jgi:hypothetical protein
MDGSCATTMPSCVELFARNEERLLCFGCYITSSLNNPRVSCSFMTHTNADLTHEYSRCNLYQPREHSSGFTLPMYYYYYWHSTTSILPAVSHSPYCVASLQETVAPQDDLLIAFWSESYRVSSYVFALLFPDQRKEETESRNSTTR